ncbi:DUF2637 domain-containing protein [Streptomyces sp. NPDC058657]|uniref:DUF2637 domain-containing protein n=1 Tax=unclassified Streptomyces TaxID=2593676 RepID=UPI0036690F11
MAAMQLTRTHRILIGVVVAGAVIIAGIGFAGSYAAVRELAVEKGFGNFSYVFPIGIDAGICVLLALDLLLTWMRIPFPLLRQTAWLLTAATIAFNGAASWPDPLGVGMHAVIPVLFVVSVEAARHAIGRIADITADKHMEGVRLTRWLLSPLPTFRLWRRMKLWELRSYEQVIKLEQDRLIYRARLQARFGRSWKRKAPVESLMPLRLAKYGIPLAETGPAGLAAAGIEPVLLPPAPELSATSAPALPAAREGGEPREARASGESREARTSGESREAKDARGPIGEKDAIREAPGTREESEAPEPAESHRTTAPQEPRAATEAPAAASTPTAPTAPVTEQPQGQHPSPWFTTPAPGPQSQQAQPQTPQPQSGYVPEQSPDQHADRSAQQYADQHPAAHETPDTPPVMVPTGPGRSRPLGGYDPDYDPEFGPDFTANGPAGEADFVLDDDAYYAAFRKCAIENGAFPTPLQYGAYLSDLYGQQLPLDELEMYAKRYEVQYQLELDEHTP